MTKNIIQIYIIAEDCPNKIIFCRYPWGKDAFKKAKEENKPIFLSGIFSPLCA